MKRLKEQNCKVTQEAEKFINEKLGENQFTHSEFSMNRKIQTEWLVEFCLHYLLLISSKYHPQKVKINDITKWLKEDYYKLSEAERKGIKIILDDFQCHFDLSQTNSK